MLSYLCGFFVTVLQKGTPLMARSPRSEYLSPDDRAVFMTVCRSPRTALAPAPGCCGSTTDGHRVEFIEDLIRRFARFFCISVHAHAILPFELRLILEARPDLVVGIDNAEAARRWLNICPSLRPEKLRCCEPTDEEILLLTSDPTRIAQIRSNLSNISWFLRLLQQRISLFCNREDDHQGRFWGDRYRSTLLLDEAVHLMGMANVDIGAVCTDSELQVSGSSFTSEVYRRLEEMEAGAVSSAREPMADDATTPDLNVGGDLTVRVVKEAAPVLQCPQSQHLAPIGLYDDPAPAVNPEIPCRFRCSDDPALRMQLTDYLQLLAWIRQGLGDSQPNRDSLCFPSQFQDMPLTGAAWILVVRDFHRLFGHVAGSPAQLEAYVTKSGKRRVWLRPAARRLFQEYYAQVVA